MVTALQSVYVVGSIGLAIIGFNALILSALYMLFLRNAPPNKSDTIDGSWPSVVVQLPIYNESHVVELLIDAVIHLDYPPEHLTIQVLDDSTDETVVKAAKMVEAFRRMGIPIEHINRGSRNGFKAGALRYGLSLTQAEFVAIFDADFAPHPDFLKRVIPYFADNPSLGMIQTRWSHLNDQASLLTYGQAIALDNHFVVEQAARQRSGLLMNFSGTAGVWRRACIEDSGGWHTDTLSEDIDLSYRAQLGGWQCLYLLDVDVPGEIPPLMMGFKQQQSRWATGTVQCLKKLGQTICTTPSLTLWQKYQALVHLGGYFIHPLMILILAVTLPLIILGQIDHLSLAGLGLAMIGPPVQALIAQSYLYQEPWRRLLHFPIFMLIGIGIGVNNTDAVIKGFLTKRLDFKRTPKFRTLDRSHLWRKRDYLIPIDHTSWIEIALGLYAFISAAFAFSESLYVLTAFLCLYGCSYMYVAGMSFWQSFEAHRAMRHPDTQLQALQQR